MEDKSTEELNKILENVGPKSIDKYLADNKEEIKDAQKSFYYFFKDTLDKKRRSLKAVYGAACIDEGYAGKIIRMEKRTSNRDLIIKLCIAGQFNLEETNRALKLYEMQPLYPRNTRDVCIIVAINKRIYDIDKINEILTENKLDIIA